MIKILVLSLLLTGQITNSNVYGRIGLKIAASGKVGHVYTHSPAFEAGLKEGDIILEADGFKHNNNKIDGTANTDAHLKVKRGKFIFELIVPRVPKEEVYDLPTDTRKLDC